MGKSECKKTPLSSSRITMTNSKFSILDNSCHFDWIVFFFVCTHRPGHPCSWSGSPNSVHSHILHYDFLSLFRSDHHPLCITENWLTESTQWLYGCRCAFVCVCDAHAFHLLAYTNDFFSFWNGMGRRIQHTHAFHSFRNHIGIFFFDASGPHRNAELNGKVFLFGKMRNCKILPPINSRSYWFQLTIMFYIVDMRYVGRGQRLVGFACLIQK